MEEEDEITPAPPPDQPPTNASELGPNMSDDVEMADVVTAMPGLYPVYYAFDPHAEHLKQTDAVTDIRELRFLNITGRPCSVCRDITHTRVDCPEPLWTSRITYCQYCGSVSLGRETEGTCYGKKSTASWGVKFRRRHTNDVLKQL